MDSFDYPYQFKHTPRWLIEEADTLERLQRLELEDRVSGLDYMQGLDIPFDTMSDDTLREMLGQGAQPVAPRAESMPRIPVHGAAPVRRERCPFPAPIRYKAQVWYQGRNCDLGWYMSISVRDEVVSEAKMLRAMGLDPRLAKRKK